MLFRGIWFCLNFAFAFLATFMGMLIIQNVTGLEASIVVLVILPLVIASMVEGQVFGRRYQVRPSGRLCWLASLRMTAMVTLMALCIIIPRLISDQQDLAELAEIEATGRALAFVLMIAVVWVLLRLGYSIGLATELKGQQFSDK